MKKHLYVFLAALITLTLLLTACGGGSVTRSSLQRITDPQVPGEDLVELVAGDNDFAFDLYHKLITTGDNQNFSPYSISLAFAMTYAGARGETAAQMADVLRYRLADEQLHAAYNALDLALAGRPEEAAGVDKEDRFELSIANSLWGQEDWPFLAGFLDLLAQNYRAGMRLVDFENNPGAARRLINDWVSDQTHKRIQDILPPGLPESTTRLALVNAIYFKATWENEFDANETSQAPFYLLDGGQSTVDMMGLDNSANLAYVDGDGWQAIALPYKGGLADMLIIMPDEGNFETFESTLDGGKYENILASLSTQKVMLHMPKFTFETKYALSDALIALGMEAAFDPDQADFSGMDGTRLLFIGDALHQAFIAVDEKGTEAAAATIVLMGMTSMPTSEINLTIDHPFFFVIRDVPTGTLLFMGRVLNP
jgi:serpin B